MDSRLHLILSTIALIAIIEGLWAIDFAVTFGGCQIFLPGYWEQSVSMGTCLNLRYWSIIIASLYLFITTLLPIMRVRSY